MRNAWKSLNAVVVVAAALSATLSEANVSLKNGNFFLGFNDMSFPGGIEPKVERVYNSKSSHDGIFGFGWGSDYEVYLRVSADASVVVYENGGGAQNRFTPPAINPKDVDAAVDEILTVKKKAGAGLTAASAESEKTRLRNDARYRNDEYTRLFEQGLVKGRQLKVGTVLKSNKFSFQTVEKVADGYLRRMDSGLVQTFSNDGKLTRIADKNRNYLKIEYDKTGHIQFVQDNLNRRIDFNFNSSGKIAKIAGDGGKKSVEYTYVNNELTKTKDSEGNVYEFRYSDDGRHNIAEVKYPDKTTLQIGYYPVEKLETVKFQKDRDGTTTTYEYDNDGAAGFRFVTKVTTKGPDSKEISKARYEYVEKTKVDGERYTYKLGTEVDGDKTETVYNECCGLPLEITKNGDKTTFEYDSKGHVTRKTTPREVTELAYDAKHGKVSKVTKFSTRDKSKKSVKWANYEYDDSGNLFKAKNSDGKAVKIVYDHNGRIKYLVDQDKRQLEFTYNEASRPVEIKDPAVGKITVQYSPSGEVKKVDSAGDRRIALKVTSAFQNLLEIIRPAGVTLAF